MRGINLEHQRLSGLRSRLPTNRNAVLVIVGAVAIAAIVLGLLLRSGPSSAESNTAAPTVAPTRAPAAVVTIPPASPTAAPSPTTPDDRLYTVAEGDTLSKIATKYYNDGSKWNKIFDANKDTLKDPDSLQVGTKLKIPE